MKILLVKTQGTVPLEIKPRHVEQVKAVSQDIEVALVDKDETQELQKHLVDCDIIAGVPWALSSVGGAKNLKWVHSFSAGMDKVLTPELISSDILASNSAGIHATPIAEHVMGFMLIFARRFAATFKKQQQKVWEKEQNLTELLGKTVLVAGLGNIGKEVARLADCFGMEVIAFDQPGKEKPSFVHEIGGKEQLSSMLSVADFVVLCLPYTKDTHHFFGKEQFENMKTSAVFMNIGRGSVVDEQALVEALQEKKIGGAALDVTEEEPLSKDSPLWDMENVVLTPHHSGWSEKYMDRAIEKFCLNLKAFLDGKPLPNLVNKELGY